MVGSRPSCRCERFVCKRQAETGRQRQRQEAEAGHGQVEAGRGRGRERQADRGKNWSGSCLYFCAMMVAVRWQQLGSSQRRVLESMYPDASWLTWSQLFLVLALGG